MKIGFIGLGHMGSGIAMNVLKAGHSLVVYNRTKSRAEALKALGAAVAETPGAAASGVEVVITMLADDRAVESVLFKPGGVLQSLAAGAIHVSMSTVSVKLSRRLVVAHSERKLFIVTAGAHDQIDRCQPLFDRIGQKTFRVGENPPAANTIKLTGNFMVSTVVESLAESFALMRKSGIAPETFLEVMTGSLFSAPSTRPMGPW
jgi:3-hydroxyisobutyrate dehydrogenase-like beta-hydroxyacid dehydrogenase